MKFQRVDLVVLAGAGLVVLVVSLLPSPRDRNPPVPDTPPHQAFESANGCVQCHTPGGSKPLAAWHPKRRDCFRCHREPAGRIK